MKLNELINPELILLDLEATDRMQVIDRLVNLLSQAGLIEDLEFVRKQVRTRESEVGTGIGYGVAIPHADPGPYKKPLALFARLKDGVDFNAPDKKKARLIILLLTPEKLPELHVRFLARICRLLKSADLRNKLLLVTDKYEAARLFADAEANYPELTP